MSSSDQAAVIIGLRRQGHDPYEIAHQLNIPVSVVERTLRTAGNRICVHTGKRCFSSEKTARRATATASNKIRVYRCEHGNHFHVTSEVEPFEDYPRSRRRGRGR